MATAFTNATVLVTQLTGQAWIRNSDGSLTALRPGMRIPVDAEIVTASGSSVELQADGMPPVMLGENQTSTLKPDLVSPPETSEAAVAPPANAAVDNLISAINAGQDPFAQLDPTAAVLAGGGGGGSTFVRLSSVLELTTPLALEYPQPGTSTVEQVQLGALAVPETTAASITLSSTGQVVESGLITVTATVTAPVVESDLLIDLGNGRIITIPVGQTTGSIVVESRPDDVLIQGSDTVIFQIEGTTGSNFAPIDITSTTTTTVVDDADPTTLILGNVQVSEGVGTASIVGTLSNPAGQAFTVTLSNARPSVSPRVPPRPTRHCFRYRVMIPIPMVRTTRFRWSVPAPAASRRWTPAVWPRCRLSIPGI